MAGESMLHSLSTGAIYIILCSSQDIEILSLFQEYCAMLPHVKICSILQPFKERNERFWNKFHSSSWRPAKCHCPTNSVRSVKRFGKSGICSVQCPYLFKVLSLLVGNKNIILEIVFSTSLRARTKVLQTLLLPSFTQDSEASLRIIFFQSPRVCKTSQNYKRCEKDT